MQTYTSFDEYIAWAPEQSRKALEEIKEAIRSVVPAETGETISYGIPTFTLNDKYLIYFAGYKKHVSVYPIPQISDQDFEAEIAPYVAGRGTLRFALDKPLPLDLIRKVAKLHVERVLAKKR